MTWHWRLRSDCRWSITCLFHVRRARPEIEAPPQTLSDARVHAFQLGSQTGSRRVLLSHVLIRNESRPLSLGSARFAAVMNVTEKHASRSSVATPPISPRVGVFSLSYCLFLSPRIAWW